MACQHINNITIRGVAACVPEHVEDNRDLQLLGDKEQKEKFLSTTGVITRHTINGREICSSDMCKIAAENLIDELGWNRKEIDCLIFVSQTPDYILPSTACILQDRLGLSNECFSMDISLGCSGWIHGMATLGALMQNGALRKGLLLAGDTSTVTKSPYDRSSFPLFGDSGTATALEFVEGAKGMFVHTATDGNGHKAIIIPDGGFRNFFNENSKELVEFEDGSLKSRLHTVLDGPTVFSFGIKRAPQSIRHLCEVYSIDLELVDYLLLHQANKILNEKIRKKLKVPLDKVPYSLDEFGNTSNASIPLTMTTRLSNELTKRKCSLLTCGFGVGLSWGSIYFETDGLVCPDIAFI